MNILIRCKHLTKFMSYSRKWQLRHKGGLPISFELSVAQLCPSHYESRDRSVPKRYRAKGRAKPITVSHVCVGCEAEDGQTERHICALFMAAKGTSIESDLPPTRPVGRRRFRDRTLTMGLSMLPILKLASHVTPTVLSITANTLMVPIIAAAEYYYSYSRPNADAPRSFYLVLISYLRE